MEFMEDDNQQATIEPTITNEQAAPVADPSRTFGEPSQTVAASSPTIAEPTTDTPQSSSFPSDKYILDSNQILMQFKTAGIERTPRAIQRYCKQGKLDARMHPTRRMYLATVASVENLIAETKQADDRHNETLFRAEPTGEYEQQATVGDNSLNGREPSANLRRQSPPISHEVPQADAKEDHVKQLEAQVQTLEIDKRVRDQIISKLEKQIRDDRNHFTERLTRFARLAESFKTRLMLLGAPKQGGGAVDGISDVEVIETSVMGQSEAFNDDLTAYEVKDQGHGRG